MVGRPGGFEKAFRAKLHRIGDLRRGKRGAFNRRRPQGDAGFRSPGKEKTHRPVAVDRVRTEQGERIGVASGKDRIDLRVEARIAGSDPC